MIFEVPIPVGIRPSEADYIFLGLVIKSNRNIMSIILNISGQNNIQSKYMNSLNFPRDFPKHIFSLPYSNGEKIVDLPQPEEA
jgi:hypothetical protein